MEILLWAFKAVAVIFPFLSMGTGAQGLFDPVGFFKSFGLPIVPEDGPKLTAEGSKAATSYVSLMGIRQFAAGVVLGVFAYQEKWTESATMLALIGPLQSLTDAYFLIKGGTTSAGLFHAIPGLVISGLAANYLYCYA